LPAGAFEYNGRTLLQGPYDLGYLGNLGE
jgi:hypothetical protein